MEYSRRGRNRQRPAPVLVGNRLKLHTMLAFISVIDAVTLFGSSGLVPGPVALAISTMLLEKAEPGEVPFPA